MMGAAMGLASRGAIAFPSTFACFLSRAYDFARMANISMLNVKMAGSHAGVSIGEDGPSQMALEDLAMMRAVGGCAVLYPSDAVSTERLIALMAYDHHGPAYMRTSRPKTPVIYDASTTFRIGGSHVVRSSADDKVTIVGAGITLFEALGAYDVLQKQGIAARVIDLYSLQPIDTETLQKASRETGWIVTVEDHYPAGGIGEAVMSAVAPIGGKVHQIAVRELPRSGRPEELVDKFGLSASHIVDAVKSLL
jgi:transketolase